jgi:hypothetical protein
MFEMRANPGTEGKRKNGGGDMLGEKESGK